MRTFRKIKTMKKPILTLIMLSAIIFAGVAQKPMNIITYNIRYNTPSDKENAWPNRREDVMKLLKFHKADIFSVQAFGGGASHRCAAPQFVDYQPDQPVYK